MVSLRQTQELHQLGEFYVTEMEIGFWGTTFIWGSVQYLMSNYGVFWIVCFFFRPQAYPTTFYVCRTLAFTTRLKEDNQPAGRIAKMVSDGKEGLQVFDDPLRLMLAILYSDKASGVFAQFNIM
ncbi:hypothetical protein Goklo_027149 [Gossypium klotzschianum]|uniref:Uncharacterized protein n=1 Tax=Gossypium klotzschianum TaxID=34286 RepID=A0A7J8TX38_9ROSI|nr:hypothetical protein [Gossypium klotzschianum]